MCVHVCVHLRLYACAYVRTSVCLSDCLSVCLSVCLSALPGNWIDCSEPLKFSIRCFKVIPLAQTSTHGTSTGHSEPCLGARSACLFVCLSVCFRAFVCIRARSSFVPIHRCMYMCVHLCVDVAMYLCIYASIPVSPCIYV